MKNYFKILCLFVFVTACGENEENLYTEFKNIQSIEAVETIDLTSTEEGRFYNPKFTATGTKAVFTTENYTGLWYYDFETKIINQLNPSIGAGLNFEVSKTGDRVYFILQSTSAKGSTKNFSIAEQDLNTKAINILFTSQSYISAPKVVDENNIAFLYGGEIKVLNSINKSFVENFDSKNVTAFGDGNSIKILKNGAEETIVPFTDGNIIWVDVSAKNDKIYFNSSVKGTGVYIIESKEVKWLGDYKYINCSEASNLSAFINYENFNNELIISFDNYKDKFNITNSAGVDEMFPSWSNDGTQIIYNTADGIIKLTKLRIITGSNV